MAKKDDHNEKAPHRLISKAEEAAGIMRSAAGDLDEITKLLPSSATSEARVLRRIARKLETAGHLLVLEAQGTSLYSAGLVAKVGKGVLTAGKVAGSAALLTPE